MRVEILLAVVGICAGLARAQEPAKKAEEPALKGPRVSDKESSKTLVEKDFSGKLKRLELPAEEAALRLVKVDDASRAKIDTILGERAAIMDKALIQNIDLVVQIHNAGQSGDKAEALKLLQEFGKKLEPLKARGKLQDEVAGALPEAEREAYRALVKEYHQALVANAMAQAKAKGEELTLGQAAGRELVAAIGQEIKRSYDRQIGGRKEDFEKLIASLNLKPEQETRIRNMVTDYGQKTKLNPTAEQKRALFGKIYRELDGEQRKALLAYYRGAK